MGNSFGQAGGGNDTRELAAAGKIADGIYSNSHADFSVALPQPPCEAKLNVSIDVQRGNAILLQCNHIVKGWGGMYTLMIYAEDWAHIRP
jgi:hypothetical protein